MTELFKLVRLDVRQERFESREAEFLQRIVAGECLLVIKFIDLLGISGVQEVHITATVIVYRQPLRPPVVAPHFDLPTLPVHSLKIFVGEEQTGF
jgi:hypothetical protein